MSGLTPVRVTDKNGRNTTVYRNLNPVKASATRAAGAPTPARPAKTVDEHGFYANGLHAATGSTIDADGYTRETQFLREWEREGEFHGRTDDADSPHVRWRHVAANLAWYGDGEALLRKVAELDDADVRTALSNNVNTPDDILQRIGTEQALRTLETKPQNLSALSTTELDKLPWSTEGWSQELGRRVLAARGEPRVESGFDSNIAWKFAADGEVVVDHRGAEYRDNDDIEADFAFSESEVIYYAASAIGYESIEAFGSGTEVGDTGVRFRHVNYAVLDGGDR